MHGLTYGVIRVDSEEKLSVLTVQDVGLVMPGGECGAQPWPCDLSVKTCFPDTHYLLPLPVITVSLHPSELSPQAEHQT